MIQGIPWYLKHRNQGNLFKWYPNRFQYLNSSSLHLPRTKEHPAQRFSTLSNAQRLTECPLTLCTLLLRLFYVFFSLPPCSPTTNRQRSSVKRKLPNRICIAFYSTISFVGLSGPIENRKNIQKKKKKKRLSVSVCLSVYLSLRPH